MVVVSINIAVYNNQKLRLFYTSTMQVNAYLLYKKVDFYFQKDMISIARSRCFGIYCSIEEGPH